MRIDPLRTVSVDRLASAYPPARVSPAIGGGNRQLEIRPEVRTKTHTAAACRRIREL